MLDKFFFMLYNVDVKNKRAINKQTPLSPNNEINKPTVGGYFDGVEVEERNETYKRRLKANAIFATVGENLNDKTKNKGLV